MVHLTVGILSVQSIQYRSMLKLSHFQPVKNYQFTRVNHFDIHHVYFDLFTLKCVFFLYVLIN